MSVRRFLGAGWASVHGPVDERKLAIWTLELGFEGLLAAPTPRPLNWTRLNAQLGDLPFEIAAVRVPPPMDGRTHGAGLGSGRVADRASAVAAIRASARNAAVLGVRTLCLDAGLVPVPGEVADDDLTVQAPSRTRAAAEALLARRRPERDRALDRVCRALFELCRELPDTTFALGASANITGVTDADGLAAVFEDQPSKRIVYWHAAGIAASRAHWLGEDQGVWLERFADRMAGIDLGDATANQADQLPGVGLVDYALLASYSRRSVRLPGVIALDPSVDPEKSPGCTPT